MFSNLKRMVLKASLLALVLSFVGFSMALGASGGLDPTFSGDGKQTINFPGGLSDTANSVALQPDGKIVTVGQHYDPANHAAAANDFAVARFNANGSPDTTFSGDGMQTTNFGASDEAWSVAIQSNGKIVVSGQSCISSSVCHVAVARYNANGSPDTTFSADGKQVLTFGGGDNGSDGGLAIQPDGKIVLAGWVENPGSNWDFAVYRLNANGSLDSTFSGDGKLSIGFGTGRNDYAEGMLLQSGKMLIIGETCDATEEYCDFALARLTSAGALDTTFSGDGRQTTNFGASDWGYGLAAQSDGKILAIGEKYSGSGDVCAIARYNANGTLDTSFSGDGKQTIASGTYAWGNAVLVQPNGKIVIAGTGNANFLVARLNANGSMDTTFSGDGKASVDFGGREDGGHGLVRQPDGKLVVSGDAFDGTRYTIALARLLP